MEKIKFSEHKDEIITKLKSYREGMNILESVTLVDGFVYLPLQDEIGGGISIGGPILPMVCVVGDTTGRLYFFALKKILELDAN